MGNWGEPTPLTKLIFLFPTDSQQPRFLWGSKSSSDFFRGFFGGTVDGWNPANQLRLVVYPIIYKVVYIPGGAGYLNHQQYDSIFPFFFHDPVLFSLSVYFMVISDKNKPCNNTPQFSIK